MQASCTGFLLVLMGLRFLSLVTCMRKSNKALLSPLSRLGRPTLRCSRPKAWRYELNGHMKVLVIFMLLLFMSGCASTRSSDSSGYLAEDQSCLDECEVKLAQKGAGAEEDRGAFRETGDTIVKSVVLVVAIPVFIASYVLFCPINKINRGYC